MERLRSAGNSAGPRTLLYHHACVASVACSDCRPTFASLLRQLKGSLAGAVNTVQAALPSFEASKFGKVVNIGTNLVYNPVVTYYDYTAAKASHTASKPDHHNHTISTEPKRIRPRTPMTISSPCTANASYLALSFFTSTG